MKLPENLDLVRYNRISEGIDKWAKNTRANGSLIYSTGLGKTMAGAIAMDRMLRTYPDYTTLIIVPTDVLVSQWTDFLNSVELWNFEVKTVHSVTLKEKTPKCNLLILDESHLYTSEIFGKIFTLVNRSWTLSLTATLDEKRKPFVTKYCPIADSVDIEEAKENKFVAEYNIYNLYVEMSWADQKRLDAWQREYFELIHPFGTIDNIYRVFQDQEYLKQLAKDLGWTIGELMGMAKRVNKIIAERKRFFFEHPYKTEVVRELLDYFSNKKTVVFAESVKFMESIEDEFAVTYHSKMGQKQKDKAMKKFKENEDKIRTLISGKATSQGLDVKGLEICINASYTSSSTTYRQRLGRVARKEANKVATIVNIVMKRPDGKKTTEDGWLAKATEGLKNIRNIEDLDEITL